MIIFFIGDIVGQPGRRAVRELLPGLKQEHRIDLVIGNGENSAGGAGITPRTAEELYDAGVDVLTTGDHLWDQKEVVELLESDKPFVRPANYPAGTPGRGSYIWRKNGFPPVAVLNLQGRTFMPAIENPFTVANAEIGKLRQETAVIFVDLHAEATSEKLAMAHMLDGKVSALVGTHTHVQTADERILRQGTAFLCDAGFTGGHEGVIGRIAEPIIERFLTNMPQRFDISKEDVRLQGALIEIDGATGRALRIERVSEPLERF